MRPELIGWIAIHSAGLALNVWGVYLAMRLASRPGRQEIVTIRAVQHLFAAAIHAISIVLGTSVVSGLSTSLVWTYAVFQGTLFACIGGGLLLTSYGELRRFPRWVIPLQPVTYNAAQVYIASVNIGVGTILALPGDTFAISRTYRLLNWLPPTEDQWALIFTGIGVACLISAYFSGIIVLRNGDDSFGSDVVLRVYRLLRLTWFVTTPLWFFWAGCFIAVTPLSIGTVFFVAIGCLSLWVYRQTTREARRAAGE